MAQDTTAKKSAYLAACVSNALAMKAARDQAKVLAEELSNDVSIAGIVDADCIGSNSHLTRTLLNNYLQVVQPAVETAIAAHLANLMAMLPT